MSGNRNRDRGFEAEREACRLLENLLGYPRDTIMRRASEGIREDLGDLIGVPDTCIQVSRCRNNPTTIAARARTKLADCALQQARRNTLHGVVLLRIDGAGARPAIWRALCKMAQLEALNTTPFDAYYWPRIGDHIRDWDQPGWLSVNRDIFVATVDTWAANWLAAMRTRTIA